MDTSFDEQANNFLASLAAANLPAVLALNPTSAGPANGHGERGPGYDREGRGDGRERDRSSSRRDHDRYQDQHSARDYKRDDRERRGGDRRDDRDWRNDRRDDRGRRDSRDPRRYDDRRPSHSDRDPRDSRRYDDDRREFEVPRRRYDDYRDDRRPNDDRRPSHYGRDDRDRHDRPPAREREREYRPAPDRERDGQREPRRDRRDGQEKRSGRSVSPNREPTPPNCQPISKRRRHMTAWDVKPPGYEGWTADQAKASGMFGLPGAPRTILPGAGLPLPPDVNGLPQFVGGAIDPMTTHTLSRQARRLYIGNLPLEATEEGVTEIFVQALKALPAVQETQPALVEDDPVIGVQLSGDKSYAFVEFKSAEGASRATSLDGLMYLGMALKVRRPKEYTGPPDGYFPTPIGAFYVPGVISNNVPDTPNKIFIGGLPTYLTDEQVQDLLKAFGDLRSFNLVKESDGRTSKGFGFCEYIDPSNTEIACEGLNGTAIGDRHLVVQRAAIGAARQAATPMYIDASPLPPAKLNIHGAEVMKPTRILMLLNMVTPEELLNDEDYQDILLDVREECEKFGGVEEIKIPRPPSDVTMRRDGPGVGKVFVKFDKEESTTKALQSLGGRKFADRTVITIYYDDDKFEQSQWD